MLPGDDHSAAPSLKVTDATYTVKLSADQLYLTLSARISGPPGRNKTFYLLGTADPATRDSLPDHHAGSTNFGLYQRLRADAEGCVVLNNAMLGYAGYCGITARVFFAVMNNQRAAALEAANTAPRRSQGFSRAELGRDVYLLQYFDVPTQACLTSD